MGGVMHRRQLMKASAVAALAIAGGARHATSGALAQEGTPAPVGTGYSIAVAGHETTVTHAQGETVVPLNPEVVLSFDIASIDTLQALGVKIAGMPEIASGGDFIDMEGVEVVGSLFEPDYERVNAMRPDLIIVAGRSAEAHGDLSSIAPTIDLTFQRGDMLAALGANTTILATLFGKQEEAATAIDRINVRADALKEAARDIGSGLVVMTSGGSVTALAPGSARAGRGALIYETLDIRPPIEDLETATHGEPISFEFLLEHDPDWLFVIDRDAATGSEDGQPAEQVLNNDIMHQTTAWQNGHIVYLNPFDWYIITGASLNSAERMLDELEAALNA